jgi:hypothetical protein
MVFFPAAQLVNTKWLDTHGARAFPDRAQGLSDGLCKWS